ncbi:hypothetical protein ACFFRR_003620 [Megaselia abdita]
MTSGNVNDFIISTVEEEIFLFVNYTQTDFESSTYIKICFRQNENFPNIILKKKISDAMPGINVMNCNFFWRNVSIAEEDLIPLIKAKAGCGHFQIDLKDKIDSLACNKNVAVRKDPGEGSSAVPVINPVIIHPDVEKIVVLEDTTTDSASESSHENGAEGVITSARFTAYINGNNHTKRLLNEDHTEPSIRRGIISCACDFLTQECGEYASVSDRNEMVKVVVDVFRGLELQEQFVTKWLHMKIKNNRRKQKLADESPSPASKKRKNDAEELNQFEFLKNCKDISNIPKIKNALKATLNIRLEQYLGEDFSVYDNYSFFLRSPDLIYYDFEIRFPNATEDVPLNLELFLDAAYNIFRAETRLPIPEEDCLPCVQKLLCICHFTKTPKGPTKPTASLSQMLESMVLFLTEEEDKKPEFKEHPILIAQGPRRSLILKYFLQIEDVLVELPVGTSFLKAFDYLMRSYYVFNVGFPKILSVFYNFIMMNVYDVHVKSKCDPKKSRIEDTLSRPREFLRKVLKCINDMK